MHKKYLTVSALTNYIKHKIDRDPHLQNVYLQGEISDFYLHRMSGHMYLTIKDEKSQIRAVMFQSDNRFLKFKPETGMSVFIEGSISVYVANGQYQLYIQKMEPSGIGALHLAFEQLKAKLQKQNYFSAEYKKKIPPFPKKIAVITSRDSAAVRDIMTTIEKRYPIVQLVILPVNVQGEQAAPSIVRAIERANELTFDTIIVARGGGSIEDLASYNDERVAMAIFHSKIPVITGIGHETDTTISDFVADLRAPTPTGAAQFAVPSLEETYRRLLYLNNELKRMTKMKLLAKKERIKRLEQSRAFLYPEQIVKEKQQRIDFLTDQIDKQIKESINLFEKHIQSLSQNLDRYHPRERIHLSKHKVKNRKETLKALLKENMRHKQYRLDLLIEKLTLLNPLQIMKRGYAITYDERNKLVKSIHQVNKNDQLQVTYFDGTISCKIKEVHKKTDGEG